MLSQQMWPAFSMSKLSPRSWRGAPGKWQNFIPGALCAILGCKLTGRYVNEWRKLRGKFIGPFLHCSMMAIM
jgi:hypothetical protein